MTKKSIKDKLQEYFFLNPTNKLRVRQIERLIKLPLPSVIKYAKELEKEEILKSSNIANVKIYSADRTSRKFLIEKRLFNIKQLYYSGFIDFIIEELSNPLVIIFGSYSRGEDIESSDIDLYIETQSKKKVNVKKFEKILQRKIQLFIHTNIREIKNKELINNIINGLTLNGFLEVYT